ncbi:MAG: hypothetical protein DRI34_02360 [Deltaproteobacteria bacterium]|nr:MAG: hypothetical protein DRI34_02360 [Deltaproteobacteria bacterium]
MTGPRNIVVTTAAGNDIGWGHLARSTALAEQLGEQDRQVTFFANRFACSRLERRRLVCRPWSTHEDPRALAAAVIARAGDADCLIVDLPGRAGRWDELRGELCRGARERKLVTVVFEDRPGALPVGATLVVNPNVGAYPPAGNSGPAFLAGPSYQPVRREFRPGQPPAMKVDIERILVCLGGGITGILEQAIGLLDRTLPGEVELLVAAGGTSIDALPERAGLLHKPDELAAAASGCDLAVVGGGQLKSEMACLGLPALVLPTAPDQHPSCRAWAEAGGRVAWSLEQLAPAIDELRPVSNRRRLAAAGRALVDGRGAERIVSILENLPAEPAREGEP